MKQLTDKTWFIYYKGFQIWLSEKEVKLIKSLMASGQKMVEISGRVFPLQDIALLKGEDNTRLEKTKKGEWQCEWGKWHQRSEQCGHDKLHQ